MMSVIFSFNPVYSDLDTQQHVNSNRYFDLFESSKYLLLEKYGISKKLLSEKGITISPFQTNFKFIKQVVDQGSIEVNTNLSVLKNRYLKWTSQMTNMDAVCFEINSVNKINADLSDLLDTGNESFNKETGLFDLKAKGKKIYSSVFKLRRIERNYFGAIPENMSWKLFEETRWDHSESLNVTLDYLKSLDIAFFWREGAYRFNRGLQSKETVKSNIWFESVGDIRLIYAHEILDAGNEIICNSVSTFIPVSISKKRPKRIPSELMSRIKDYI